LALHTEYQKNPLILSGESYAGKYIPNLAKKILANQGMKGNLLQIPSALLIGDGLIDPLVQRNIRPEQAYWGGFLSFRQLQQEASLREECIRHIQLGNTEEKGSACEDMRNFIMLNSGIVNIYDVRTYYPSNNKTVLEQYLNQESFKQAVHTTRTNPYITCDPVVYDHLKYDILINIKSMLPELSSYMRIVLFAGNFDLQDGPIGIDQMLLSMGEYAEPFKSAPRNLWFSSVNKVVAGYEQTVGNVSFVIIHGAGHYVPQHQPSNSLDMVTRVANKQPLCMPGESISLSYTELTPAEYKKYLYDPKSGEYRLPCAISQLVCQHVLENCHGNGVCIDGRCTCKDGFGGEQCLDQIVDGTKINSVQATNFLPQQWQYVKIAIPPMILSRDKRRKVEVTLSWSQQNVSSVADATPPILNIPDKKVCIYALKDRLPTYAQNELARCSGVETDMQLSFSLTAKSDGDTYFYLGVFNAQPFPISYSIAYESTPEAVNAWTYLMSFWQFWLLFGLLGLFTIGFLVAFIIAMTYIRSKLNPRYAVRLPD
jgi:hypothetical protein